MNILQWAHSLGNVNGGLEEFVASLSAELSERGNSVTVVTDKPADIQQVSLSRYPPRVGFHFIDIDAQERHDTGLAALRENWSGLEALVSNDIPDVIHLHSLGRGDVSLLNALRTRFSIPVVYTAHSPVDAPGLEPFFRPLAEMTSAIIAPSNFMRTMIDQHLPSWNSVTVTIPNGVEDFGTRAETPAGKQIFASGRHSPEKGFSNLVAAMAIVVEHVPDARLVLAGSGAETPTLKRLAKLFDVSSAIEWAGWLPRPEARNIAAQSSAIAVPSLWNEPFGLVAAEAAMAGRPVVASAVGGLPEIVVSGKTGFLYRAGDISILGMSLVKILTNKSLRMELGVAAREHARTHFSLDKNVASHLDLYRSVTNDAQKRASRGN